MRPKITKTLKGALGETYYKELCSQKGWAYCSLETIHNCKNLDNVVFKMGFDSGEDPARIGTLFFAHFLNQEVELQI